MRKRRRLAISDRHSISYQLREIIESRDMTPYAVGTASGVDPGILSRFLRGERGMQIDTLDRVAGALGLRLVEVAKRGRPPGRASRSVEPPAELGAEQQEPVP